MNKELFDRRIECASNALKITNDFFNELFPSDEIMIKRLSLMGDDELMGFALMGSKQSKRLSITLCKKRGIPITIKDKILKYFGKY